MIDPVIHDPIYAPAIVVDVRTQGAGTLTGYQVEDGPHRGQTFVAHDADRCEATLGSEVMIRILNDGIAPSTFAMLAPRTVATLGATWPWPTIAHARRRGWATWWETTADTFYRGLGDVPPMRMLPHGHVLGEAAAHDADGTPIAAVYWTSNRPPPGAGPEAAPSPRYFVREQRIEPGHFALQADAQTLETTLLALQAPVRTLICACCGETAGIWRQWHNRDRGFGVCGRCIARIADRESPAEIRMRYGIPGVHFPHYAIG